VVFPNKYNLLNELAFYFTIVHMSVLSISTVSSQYTQYSELHQAITWKIYKKLSKIVLQRHAKSRDQH